MKKCYLIIALPLLFGSYQSKAQKQEEGYVFPIKPGMEAWQQFKTGQAMVEACQVPDETLRTMSTKGLVATCLHYPLLSTLLAHNDLQSGFLAVTTNFNGLQELLRRPDAGQQLLQMYQQMNPDAVTAREVSKRGAFTFEFTYVEVLLAQPAILESLTAAERKALVKICFTTFKAKDNHLDSFGEFGELTSALVLGRVLEKDQFSTTYRSGQRSPAMQAFLATGRVQDPQLINRIVADAQVFSK